jgi:hypothetical protein
MRKLLFLLICLSVIGLPELAQATEIERHFGKACFTKYHSIWRHRFCVTVNMHDFTGQLEGLVQIHPDPDYDDATHVYQHFVSLWENEVRRRLTNFYAWYSGRYGVFPSSLSTEWWRCTADNQYTWYYAKSRNELKWPDNVVTGSYDEFSFHAPIFCG